METNNTQLQIDAVRLAATQRPEMVRALRDQAKRAADLYQDDKHAQREFAAETYSYKVARKALVMYSHLYGASREEVNYLVDSIRRNASMKAAR